MDKNKYVVKILLVVLLPVFTFIYLDNSLGLFPSAIVGLILLIVLSIVLFLKKEKRNNNIEKR
jgi:uncharacterized membrane protein